MDNPFQHTHSPSSNEPLRARSMGQVFDSFMDAPLPDAIDAHLFRASMASDDESEFSGFERYAARLFTEVQASNLRSIAVEHPLNLRILSSTHLYYISFDPEGMTDEQLTCVLSVEMVLNRLVFIRNRLMRDMRESKRKNEIQCSYEDIGSLAAIADAASHWLEGIARSNRLLTLRSTTGKRGGTWDISTRFAFACESVALPFRLEYCFDCDAEAGIIAVDISLPTPQMMPRSHWNDMRDGWRDLAPLQGKAASAYGLRLAALVAACAFGTSLGITRVIINGYELSLEGPCVMALEFDRMNFVMKTMKAINSEDFSNPAYVFDPAVLFAMLQPKQWVLNPTAEGRNQPVDPLPSGLTQRRIPVADDTRILPRELAELLQADRVSDLDVMSDQDPELMERFKAAMEDRKDAQLLAIAQLEEITNAQLLPNSDKSVNEIVEDLLNSLSESAGAAGAAESVGVIVPDGAAGASDEDTTDPTEEIEIIDADFEGDLHGEQAEDSLPASYGTIVRSDMDEAAAATEPARSAQTSSISEDRTPFFPTGPLVGALTTAQSASNARSKEFDSREEDEKILFDTAESDIYYHTLYCDGVFARYTTSLFDPDPRIRYVRASDAIHAAHVGLSELYMQLGDINGAIAEAAYSLNEAMTSVSAYQDLITIYAHIDRYDLVIETAKQALRFAVIDDTYAYLYYRLAFALWRCGRLVEAAACYAMIPQHNTLIDATKAELRELLEEMTAAGLEFPSDPKAILRAAGIIVAPSSEALDTIAHALVRLTDNNMPIPASHLCIILGHEMRDDVISATARSLREGVAVDRD